MEEDQNISLSWRKKLSVVMGILFYIPAFRTHRNNFKIMMKMATTLASDLSTLNKMPHSPGNSRIGVPIFHTPAPRTHRNNAKNVLFITAESSNLTITSTWSTCKLKLVIHEGPLNPARRKA